MRIARGAESAPLHTSAIDQKTTVLFDPLLVGVLTKNCLS